MQLARAAYELETLVQARARAGRNAEISQVDLVLADESTSTVAVAYIYFEGDADEPAVVPIDLGRPMSEQELEAERAAVLMGLLSLAPTSPVH